MLNELELTGQARTHVKQLFEPRFAAQAEVCEAFLAMREDAKKSGFDLLPFSSFRDFDTQLRIWNYKFLGKKPLYDIDGNIRDYKNLTDEQIIEYILNWSALPGGSRHQWGTEIDIVDGLVMPQGYKPKLLPEEVQRGGIFYSLHQWLDENIAKFGFFRPYKVYQGGMFPEPWHLSYAPLSMPALGQVSIKLLTEVISNAEIEAKDRVLEKIHYIYQNHILNINLP